MRYTWRGVLCNKNPFDMALYPMLLWERKPRTIIEIGSKEGGSAIWLADICARFGIDVRIVSVDIDQPRMELPGPPKMPTQPQVVPLEARLREPAPALTGVNRSHPVR